MKEAKPSAISSLTAARLRNAQVGDTPSILRYVSEGSPLDPASSTSLEPTHLTGRHAESTPLAHSISDGLSGLPDEPTTTTLPEQRRAHFRVAQENIQAAGRAINDRRFAEEVCLLNKATILSLRAY